MKIKHTSVSVRQMIIDCRDYYGRKSRLRDVVKDGKPFGDIKELRKHLKLMLKAGIERVLAAESCEGFSPLTGCPGHIVPDDYQVTPKWSARLEVGIPASAEEL